MLNHEARGAGGAPMTFRMSSPNGELLEVLAGAPGASADSGSEATFEALPHDTDFTPFEQAGLYGYDTAIMADGAYYHSPLDDPAHLSAASLQQMGDTTLALTRELAGMDLGAIADGGEEIVTDPALGPAPVSAEPGDSARDRCPGPRSRAGVGVAATRCADAAARRPVGRRFGRSARGRRRRRLRGVAGGAADRPRTGFCRDRGALPARASTGWRCCSPGCGSSSRCSRCSVGGWVPSASPSACSSLLALAGVLLAFTLPGLSGAVVQPTLVVVDRRGRRGAAS